MDRRTVLKAAAATAAPAAPDLAARSLQKS
jgi:hypothetical protein